jgi:hypothetical protein
MERKRRERTLPASAFLKPINIRDFGDDEKDPCFGKHFDLTTPECQACGDSEFCAAVKAQKLKSERLIQEKNGMRLDLEMSDSIRDRAIRKYVNSLISEGEPRMKVIKKASMKFSLKKEIIKSIIK